MKFTAILAAAAAVASAASLDMENDKAVMNFYDADKNGYVEGDELS